MLDHAGVKFFLTQNFRCSPQIDRFAKYFQFYRRPADLMDWTHCEEDEAAVNISVQTQQVND